MIERIKQIVVLSAIPVSIFYPIPLVPFLIFSLASKELTIINFLKLTFFSFIFFASINLWNHVNDVEEDKLSGRENIFSENPKIRIVGIALSISLYILSILISVFWTLDYRGLYLFLVVVCLTWIYSDKIFVGKYIPRFKQNYFTELITYSVSYPFFILSLWSLISEINFRAIAIALLLLFFGLWNIFLKDIKDISADEKVGLNTVAIKFGPEKCIKYSIFSLSAFYILILFFALLGVFMEPSIYVAFFIIIPVYLGRKLQKVRWIIKPDFAVMINIMAKSNLFAMFLLGLINLLKLY